MCGVHGYIYWNILFIKMNNTFPTDLGSGNRIPNPREDRKILPQGAKRRGEEFFDLPEGLEFYSHFPNP